MDRLCVFLLINTPWLSQQEDQGERGGYIPRFELLLPRKRVCEALILQIQWSLLRALVAPAFISISRNSTVAAEAARASWLLMDFEHYFWRYTEHLLTSHCPCIPWHGLALQLGATVAGPQAGGGGCLETVEGEVRFCMHVEMLASLADTCFL